jgi:hypothetical protein
MTRTLLQDDQEVYVRLLISSPPCHRAEEHHAIDSKLFGDPLLRCPQCLVNVRRKRKIVQSFHGLLSGVLTSGGYPIGCLLQSSICP